jgi:hypothetical protein
VLAETVAAAVAFVMLMVIADEPANGNVPFGTNSANT